MSTRTIYLSRLIGVYLIIVGLFMIARRGALTGIIGVIDKDQAWIFFYGLLALVVGLAIVLAHNVWSGGVAAIIVTIIGWLSLLKGLSFLVFPLSTESMVAISHFNDFSTIYAIVLLIVGLYLTYTGFSSRLSGS